MKNEKTNNVILGNRSMYSVVDRLFAMQIYLFLACMG